MCVSWKSEENLQNGFPLPPYGSWELIRLGSKSLYPRSHPSTPQLHLKFRIQELEQFGAWEESGIGEAVWLTVSTFRAAAHSERIHAIPATNPHRHHFSIKKKAVQ